MSKKLVFVCLITGYILISVIYFTKNGNGNIINELCHKPLFPPHLITEQKWVQADEENHLFVFSAYFVADKKLVYVIGARLRNATYAVCRLWYTSPDSTVDTVITTNAVISIEEEGWPNAYTSTVFECPVSSREAPSYVSIDKRPCEMHRNLLIVQNSTPKQEYKYKYTVCLSPLFDFGQIQRLVEWIELNRILGADRFVIYSYSVTKQVQKVLDYYTSQRLVEVIHWRPDLNVAGEETWRPIEIHYHAQTAALNDCLYRVKQDSEFMVNIDLDEFIIPHSKHSRTWTEMIAEIKTQHRAGIKRLLIKPRNTFVFKSTFFPSESEYESNHSLPAEVIKNQRLATLNVCEREEKIFPYTERTKYITSTRDLVYTFIHKPGTSNYLVSSVSIGLVHHYRKDSLSPNLIKDCTVKHKFETDLVSNVTKVWKDLYSVDLVINQY